MCRQAEHKFCLLFLGSDMNCLAVSLNRQAMHDVLTLFYCVSVNFMTCGVQLNSGVYTGG